MATAIHEFSGVRFRAEWTEFGDRVTGDVRLPSGSVVTYEIGRKGHSCFWDQGGAALRTEEDREAADRLWPLTVDPRAAEFGLPPTPYRRATPEFAAAAWAAAGVDRAGPPPVPVWVPSAADRAETLAMADLEGTPVGRRSGRPDRVCVECGSPVYGEFCTHCHEC